MLILLVKEFLNEIQITALVTAITNSEEVFGWSVLTDFRVRMLTSVQEKNSGQTWKYSCSVNKHHAMEVGRGRGGNASHIL
jgi:hypothetical protein